MKITRENKIIVNIAKSTINEWDDVGCGMYNLDLEEIKELSIPNSRGLIVQVYPYKENLCYELVFVLNYYSHNEHDEYEWMELKKSDRKLIMKAIKEKLNIKEDSPMFKKDLYDFMSDSLSIEQMITIINAYEEDRMGECEESIFDLNNEVEYNQFINLYGSQTAERCKKQSQFWMGGNAYYANNEDRDCSRSLKIYKVDNDKAVDILGTIISEIEERFEDFLDNYSKEDTINAILAYEKMYSFLIDFNGYVAERHSDRLEKKKYTFDGKVIVTINKVEVEATNEKEAEKLAKEQIYNNLTCYGSFDTQLDRKDISLRCGK